MQIIKKEKNKMSTQYFLEVGQPVLPFQEVSDGELF